MTSLADRCVARFTAAKAEGRKLSMLEVHQIIEQEAAHEAPKTHARPTTKTLETSDDAAWILYLESLPHLAGIDIKKEVGRCQFWASTNGVKASRRRICNWLLKAKQDAPITFNGQGQSSFKPRLAENVVPNEPENWRVVCNTQEAYAQFKDRDWPTIPRYYQEQILKQIR